MSLHKYILKFKWFWGQKGENLLRKFTGMSALMLLQAFWSPEICCYMDSKILVWYRRLFNKVFSFSEDSEIYGKEPYVEFVRARCLSRTKIKKSGFLDSGIHRCNVVTWECILVTEKLGLESWLLSIVHNPCSSNWTFLSLVILIYKAGDNNTASLMGSG